MDLNGVVRLIFEKSDLIMGISIALLLTVVVLMLVRSAIEDRENEKQAQASDGQIDQKTLGVAVEGAMKRVFADKSFAGAAGSVGASGAAGASASGDVGDSTELRQILSEREAKISALMSDLEALKSRTDAVSSSVSPNGGVASEGGADVGDLHAKLAELQAKLAEYEIIEDDIADLSMFKEENKKLKAELATLKAAVETAQTQVQAAQVSVSAAPLAAVGAVAPDPVQAAQAAITHPAPKAEKFELDKNDEVMGEFAQALAVDKAPAADPQSALIGDQPITDTEAAISAILQEKPEASATVSEPESDPFGGELDTDKMLAEVSSMAEAGTDSAEQSILDAALDTDKLMAEMGIGEEPASQPITDRTTSINSTPLDVDKPVAVEAGAVEKPAQVQIEDDLLAEFKDTEFSNTKNTKGS